MVPALGVGRSRSSCYFLLLLGLGLAGASLQGVSPSLEEGVVVRVEEVVNTSLVMRTPFSCPSYCSCSQGGRGWSAVCDGEGGGEELGRGLVPPLGRGVGSLEVRGCGEEGGWARLGEVLLELVVRDCDNISSFGDFGVFTKLRQLTISSSMPPSPLSCSLLASLTFLTITNCSLPSLDLLSHCKGPLPLLHLDLATNSLPHVDWRQLEIFPRLRNLSLADSPLLQSMSPPSHSLALLSHLSLHLTPLLQSLCTSLLSTLPALSSLDLSGSGLTSLPTHLLLMPNLTNLLLPPLTPPCSCSLTLLLQQHSMSHLPPLSCLLPSGRTLAAATPSIMDTLSCSGASLVTSPEPSSQPPGVVVTLPCSGVGTPYPTVIWLTPSLELLRWREEEQGCEANGEELLLLEQDRGRQHLSILANGSLVIGEFGWSDRGNYTCYVDNRCLLLLPSTGVNIFL